MIDPLEKLLMDTIQYRKAVDEIFAPSLVTSKSWQACFAEILLCTAELYRDCLLVAKRMSDLETASESKQEKVFPTNIKREAQLREGMRQKFASSGSWPGFVPENPFSDLTGLRTLRDYVNSFTLHLPEIYEETFRAEACTKSFLRDHDNATLTQLSVWLQHLGRNHASFVLQPLAWAADDCSWED